MKYGLELQQNIFAPWRLSYVAYDILKQELKSRQLDHGWTERDEADFIPLLDNELTKVYDFINAKLAEIDARILYCERTIQTLQKNPNMASESNYAIMDEALTEILFDVNDLSRFTRVNFTAIQKILKKHDKWTGLNLKQDYVKRLREKPLDKQRFDIAIVYISALHDICRNRGRQSPGNPASGGDQNAFERATAKYWIHPDNITEVKAIIMLHLPVLIFNKAKKWEPSDSAISSVYFDNRNFDLYTGRLQRDEGAEAIRFRWYGPMDTPSAFIERKTHHAPWLNGASVKDRFKLEASQINNFMAGTYTADHLVNDLRKTGADETFINDSRFIAHGVQTSFREKQLEPMLRVFYNRTAFQLPDDQKLRISLDTNLTFIREDHLDETFRRHPSHNWRRNDVGIDYPFHYINESDVLRFPYAVLETKLQTHLGQEPPQWLTSLIESHLVHEVPRFSKYLHGACHFYRERLPLLPWWLAEMNVDIRKPRAENIGLTRSRSFKPLIDGRYRRAMIEEKERKNQQAVVQGSRRSSSAGDRSSGTAYSKGQEFTAIDVKSSATIQGEGPPVPEKPKHTSSLLPPRLSYFFSGERFFSNQRRSSGVSRGVFSSRRKSGSETALDEEDAPPRRFKTKVRVEPKVFFANERTFISWLQFCALLLTVALSLLNFGDDISRAVGGVFIGLAAAIAIYALYRFEKRAWMINHRIDGRYDDLWGPAVLCVLLVMALVVNFYLRFR
ncbi:VTC domain-containing protein [Radiomyces spectabilis]|uniref:VTC domain-containing protein n=1 Tax=Radiomyces spectabilis TaxID=64574 RepID=UPI00221EF774|nr:VTC domain-containing protein [Radiomyces spectabilis]KAI8374508.1 VTC domain-containing protein [Radiomyces spectabilis]